MARAISTNALTGNSVGIGGGIYSNGSLGVKNGIVANNIGGNCAGNVLGVGASFDDDGSCEGAAPIAPGVDFDTTLANNGGPTATHALLAGGVAVDAAEVESVAIEPDDESGAFVLSTELRFGRPPPDASETLALFPDALDVLPRVSLRRRRGVVRFGHSRTIRYETEFRGVAHGTIPETDLDRSGSGWAVRAHTTADGTTARGTLLVELSRPRFDPGDFEELELFWRTARRAAAPRIRRVE